MAKKERNTGSVGRARAKRGSAGDMSAEEFEASLARRRAASSFDEQTQNEDFFRGSSAEDTMKMLRGPTRPMPNPRRSVEAPGSGLDQGPSRAEMERGSSAPGRSMRPTARPQRFEKGGKVNGFPDLNNDGKVTRADVLKGRGVEGFADGGMVRGCKPGQMSGKGFRGSF